MEGPSADGGQDASDGTEAPVFGVSEVLIEG